MSFKHIRHFCFDGGWQVHVARRRQQFENHFLQYGCILRVIDVFSDIDGTAGASDRVGCCRRRVVNR